jgi:hypothetical protein
MVNTVMSAIAQHESGNVDDQIQISGNKTDGFYDGHGRGAYQYENFPDGGGNTAMNRNANFLKYNTDKELKDFPNLYNLAKNTTTPDFSLLSRQEQDGLFIGDKIFGGPPRRNMFDLVTRNRTESPTQEEVFQYWLRNHKGKVNNKTIDKLTKKEIDIERQKWNKRTIKIFK